MEINRRLRMHLAWIEVRDQLLARIAHDDYQNLTPLLNNTLFLKEAYALPDELNESISSCVERLAQLPPHETTQIQDTLQALCHGIQQVIDRQINPLMHNQTWLLTRMRAIGYKIIGLGECYGLSNMAIQAFLANDLNTFNQRLQTIYHLPVVKFENNFALLRKEAQDYLSRNEIEKANELHQLIIDLHAFFDGVALTQRPDFYLHNEKMQPLSEKQDYQKTMPIILPTTLDHNPPALIATFTGVYTRDHLQTYLELLATMAGKTPFALNLISNLHAITLLFDAKNRQWILIDPSHLPAEAYTQHHYAAQAILDCFERITLPRPRKNCIVMGTQIITTTEHQQTWNSHFQQLSDQPLWQQLHKQPSDFSDYFNYTATSLYQKFYGDNEFKPEWNELDMLM